MRRGRLDPYGLKKNTTIGTQCIRYYKRTLWHSLTTACIATDANSESSVSPQPNAHDHDPSKSTSLTACVQPPVNSFRAILYAVQQSYEISRARARERERCCCPLTNVVESCCVAQHGSQAVVYRCFVAQLASRAALDFPLLRYGSVSCGHACSTRERECAHVRTEYCI